jgi:hypothetical protein
MHTMQKTNTTDGIKRLDLQLAFEHWAPSQGLSIEHDDKDESYTDPRTAGAWLGYQAAFDPANQRQVGQQLYAEIKKSSQYAHQAEWCRNQGYGYPFKVRIREASDGYVVKGGVGGQYSLADVNLYVLEGGKKIRVK